MASVVFWFEGTTGRQPIEFDAVLEVTPRDVVEACKWPLENGASITDHVISRPLELQVVGIVSETSVRAWLTPNPGKDRPQLFWEALREVQAARETVRLVTGLRVYPRMLITSIEAPLDAESRHALKITVGLTECLIAYSTYSKQAKRKRGRRRMRIKKFSKAALEYMDQHEQYDRKPRGRALAKWRAGQDLDPNEGNFQPGESISDGLQRMSSRLGPQDTDWVRPGKGYMGAVDDVKKAFDKLPAGASGTAAPKPVASTDHSVAQYGYTDRYLARGGSFDHVMEGLAP